MRELYRRWVALLDRARDLYLLTVRLFFGVPLLAIGLAKLGDLEGTTLFFESLGIPLPSVNAALVGVTETVGGLLLTLGGLARVAPIAIAACMLTAILVAHGGEPVITAKPFPYLLAALIVLIFGPGAISLDAALARRATPSPA